MSLVDLVRATQRALGLAGIKSGDFRTVNLFVAGIYPIDLAFGNVNMRFHGNNRFSIFVDEPSRFDFWPLVGGSSLKRDIGNLLRIFVNCDFWLPFSIVPMIFGGAYPVIFIGAITIPR